MDRVAEALLEALRAALAAGEQRLYRSGKLAGLFPGRTGPAGSAAEQALRDGLLEVVRTETKGKTSIDWVRVTPRGVDFLHEHESPLRALHEVRTTLRHNRQALPDWLGQLRDTLGGLNERLTAEAERWTQRLQALEKRVDEALRRLEASGPLLPREVIESIPWSIDALNYLDRRRSGGAPKDCALPELFAAVVRHHPNLSISAFHEGLRRLHERRALLLAPAASPTDLAQPEYALFDEAGVFYFATR
jgi:hypothetical protein